LATDAGQWLVRVPESSDVRIDDDSDTVRAGVHATDDAVAEALVDCLLRVRGASRDDAAVRAELARHGYELPSLQSVTTPQARQARAR
jgi:hypothetical protein